MIDRIGELISAGQSARAATILRLLLEADDELLERVGEAVSPTDLGQLFGGGTSPELIGRVLAPLADKQAATATPPPAGPVTVRDSENVSTAPITARDVQIGNRTTNILREARPLSDREEQLLSQQKRLLYQNLPAGAADADRLELPLIRRKGRTISFNTLNREEEGTDFTGQAIGKVFREVYIDSMLILGEPGSGKTSLLCELGHQVAVETETERRGLVPLLLNLSGWDQYPQREEPGVIFRQWLLGQVADVYGLRGEDYETLLLESKKVLLLFDGLDEVAASRRGYCLRCLNAFLDRYRPPCVVTCRTEEYELLLREAAATEAELVGMLRLNGTLEILPIHEEEVTRYLEHQDFLELCLLYKEDENLRELLNTPLWLTIITKAYWNQDWEQQRIKKDRDWRDILMSAYENWILDQRIPEWNDKHRGQTFLGKRSTLDKEDVTNWMAWLAFTLDREGEQVFYLERLQPWVLPDGPVKRFEVYSEGVMSLYYGLCGYIVFAIAYNQELAIKIFGLLAMSFFCGHFTEPIALGVFPRRLALSINAATVFIIFYTIIFGSQGSIAVACGMALLIYMINPDPDKIQVVQIAEQFHLPMTWNSLWNIIVYIVISLVLGIGLGLIWGLSQIMQSGLFEGLVSGAIFGALMGATIGLTVLLNQHTSVNPKTLRTNQGINRSLRYSMIAFIPGLLMLALTFQVPHDYKLLSSLQIDLRFFGALLSFLLVAFLPEQMGILGVLKHYLIRLLLKTRNYIPGRYGSFLDTAARLGYLRRSGGAFRFYHREFKEYMVKDYGHDFTPLYKSKLLRRKQFSSK